MHNVKNEKYCTIGRPFELEDAGDSESKMDKREIMEDTKTCKVRSKQNTYHMTSEMRITVIDLEYGENGASLEDKLKYWEYRSCFEVAR